jgi:hypothetical protein
MRFATTSALLLASIAVAACGESSEDKAQTTVCNARVDISKQVDELKGMTPATFTADAASGNLNAIRGDLQRIRDAQGDLGDDRREQVQKANQEFAAEVRSVASEVFRSSSAEQARSDLTASLAQLADTYEQTYARVDCS